VVLVIAFVGASFELLKHLPTSQNVSWEKENLHYGMDGKPYSVRELPKKLRAHARPAAHIAGDSKVLADALKTYNAAVQPTATEAEHKDAPAKAAAAEKKKINEDDYEIVIDPVTGKKVKRKKKKEAKKEDAKPKTVASSQPIVPTTADKEELTDARAIAAAIAESAATGEIPLPIKPSSVAPFAGLQEWERLLLLRPDLAETKVFIQAFKSHTVSSDIYYKIIKLMLADSRPEMKSLGILCAGSVPSVLSFQILASAATTGTSDLKTNAQKYLDAYSASLANLAILQGVLRAGDNTASTIALRQLDAAAARFLTSTTTTPAPGTQNNHSPNAAQFQPFVAILTQMGSSTDSTLASQAHQTLANLEKLLDGATSTSNLAQTP
ncbi:MAG: hypothetical protein ACXVA9_13995, partial [Bdellovibrionales bacterium]